MRRTAACVPGLLSRLQKNWFAVNEPSILSGAPSQVINLLADRLLLRRVFPQPVSPGLHRQSLASTDPILE
jgi:hypothetical protein